MSSERLVIQLSDEKKNRFRLLCMLDGSGKSMKEVIEKFVEDYIKANEHKLSSGIAP